MTDRWDDGSLRTAESTSREKVRSICDTGDENIVEPVAIVGLSFGFPQEATSSDAFWELLMSKQNTATEFPQSRLNISSMYHPDHSRKGQVRPGKNYLPMKSC